MYAEKFYFGIYANNYEIGLENPGWSTVVRMYVCGVVVVLLEKLAVTHRRRFLLAVANKKYTYCPLFDCYYAIRKARTRKKEKPEGQYRPGTE
ncbi:hypothetical protein T02_4589 [Trichinella nativa]|uniref:Uncharacterized protein n=1 Tax=Trichinella nativa TaxID=6335 RepID=A0A0V1L8J4_9BILA|nr:hypothetical protein T02_4589 [Trichinella nativa]